jgi:hypothetical protein
MFSSNPGEARASFPIDQSPPVNRFYMSGWPVGAPVRIARVVLRQWHEIPVLQSYFRIETTMEPVLELEAFET